MAHKRGRAGKKTVWQVVVEALEASGVRVADQTRQESVIRQQRSNTGLRKFEHVSARGKKVHDVQAHHAGVERLENRPCRTADLSGFGQHDVR